MENKEEKKKISFESLKEVRKLFGFLKPYQKTYTIGMVMLLFSTGVALLFPILMGEITRVLQGESRFTLNEIVLVFAIILVFQGVFSYFRVVLFSIVSEKATADIRKVVYKKIISAPFLFFEENRVGDLISRLTSDISSVQTALVTTVADFFRQIATLTLGLAYLFYVSWKLTLFMLITLPIMVVAAMVFGRFVRKFSKTVQTKLADSNVVVDESLQSISTVKAYTNERHEYERYSVTMNEVVKLSIKLAKYRGMFISFFIVGLFGGICLVIWFGGNLILDGEIQLGDLISFLFASIFIAGSMGGLGELYTSIQRTIGASERILEILDEDEEINLNVERLPFEKYKGDIVFEDLSFSYPSRKDIEVLKGINIEIEAGEKIALVGHSGAGKSTLIQLLLKYYTFEQGQILVDGLSLNDLDVTQLRENIAIVPQEVILFGGSIYENIIYGRPGATREEVEEAARMANALEFIEKFPERFDTLVGERGVKLSGGQKQRLAIARAILKDPAILILDEATSSLDSQSEVLIQEAMQTLMENRTSIIIAHRLATIRNVDKIYVLKEGKIVEQGSHEELMSQNEGLYAQMVNLQINGISLEV